MNDRYCEQCGCRILTAEDVGLVEHHWDTWGPGGLQVARKTTVICTACVEEEERMVEPFAEYEAAFERWAREQSKLSQEAPA